MVKKMICPSIEAIVSVLMMECRGMLRLSLSEGKVMHIAKATGNCMNKSKMIYSTEVKSILSKPRIVIQMS